MENESYVPSPNRNRGNQGFAKPNRSHSPTLQTLYESKPAPVPRDTQNMQSHIVFNSPIAPQSPKKLPEGSHIFQSALRPRTPPIRKDQSPLEKKVVQRYSEWKQCEHEQNFNGGTRYELIDNMRLSLKK